MSSFLLVVTHLQGVGHLARMAALGRGLAEAGQQVTLVSGGLPVPWIDVSGLRLVQLPPARIENNDFRSLLDADRSPVDEAWWQARGALLSSTLEETRPDVVVTELYPFGRRVLSREFDALLRQLPAGTIAVSSVRDVLVAPSSPSKALRANERIDRFYSSVLVHGDRTFLPLEESWPVTPDLAEKLVYTGYVSDRGPSLPTDGPGAGEILVSAGGSATGRPLFEAALGAAALWPDGPPWRLLVGDRLADSERAAFAARATGRVTIEPAREDFRALLARCAVAVARGGYNTVVDTVATSARTVIIPFEDGRETEQRQRAEVLARRSGAHSLLLEGDLTEESLLDAVRNALRRPVPKTAPFSLDGVANSVATLVASARRRTIQSS